MIGLIEDEQQKYLELMDDVIPHGMERILQFFCHFVALSLCRDCEEQATSRERVHDCCLVRFVGVCVSVFMIIHSVSLLA